MVSKYYFFRSNFCSLLPTGLRMLFPSAVKATFP